MPTLPVRQKRSVRQEVSSGLANVPQPNITQGQNPLTTLGKATTAVSSYLKKQKDSYDKALVLEKINANKLELDNIEYELNKRRGKDTDNSEFLFLAANQKLEEDTLSELDDAGRAYYNKEMAKTINAKRLSVLKHEDTQKYNFEVEQYKINVDNRVNDFIDGTITKQDLDVSVNEYLQASGSDKYEFEANDYKNKTYAKAYMNKINYALTNDDAILHDVKYRKSVMRDLKTYGNYVPEHEYNKLKATVEQTMDNINYTYKGFLATVAPEVQTEQEANTYLRKNLGLTGNPLKTAKDEVTRIFKQRQDNTRVGINYNVKSLMDRVFNDTLRKNLKDSDKKIKKKLVDENKISDKQADYIITLNKTVNDLRGSKKKTNIKDLNTMHAYLSLDKMRNVDYTKWLELIHNMDRDDIDKYSQMRSAISDPDYYNDLTYVPRHYYDNRDFYNSDLNDKYAYLKLNNEVDKLLNEMRIKNKKAPTLDEIETIMGFVYDNYKRRRSQ